MNGPDRVVLVRFGVAEVYQHPVAHVFRHVSSEAGGTLAAASVIGIDEFAQVLGIDLCRKRGRAHEITEHDGEGPAFGGGRGGIDRLRPGHWSLIVTG